MAISSFGRNKKLNAFVFDTKILGFCQEKSLKPKMAFYLDIA